ncbi:branched-chain amino acid ABC transporter permease [Rhodospirillaceae bacterium]|nr:branched-chain amino acid ABC transporter permease [Alphaproteobacteria bacterium]MDC1427805.1 branched-chain amino acid ABC transporter permease [Rhodospirillaceae bacterium]
MQILNNFSFQNKLITLVFSVLFLLPIYTGLTGNEFYLDLANRLMILAIAAASLNLILGHGGMISFGHAAYLGIGAYSVGIPAYYDINNGLLQLFLAVAVSGIFALVTGAICLRTKGVYFIMITMAFTQMVFFGFVSIEEYGGDDGLVINTRSNFGQFLNIDNNLNLYYFILVSLVACLFLIHKIVRSQFGLVIEGSRSNDQRMRSIGFDTYRYRLICYVIAGCMCGYAGALLGNFTNFISPEMMDWSASGELIFMVILGGTGSILGPVFGAAAFVILEEWLSSLTLYWHFIFGGLLIIVVLFAKGGINGILAYFGNGKL